jgi:beta-phosphoglucomutase-like phosphatase (HAD superfamily)
VLACDRINGQGIFDGLGGIIFDCDGVMIDSLEANRRYYNILLERLGQGPMTGTQETYVHAHHVRESLAHIFPPELLERAEAARLGLDYRDILPSLSLEEGLVEFVVAVRRAGMWAAINTNRSDTMELLLDHFGLRGFFAPVVTAATVARPKPDPEGILKILRAWDLAPGQVAYIGDTTLDEQAALAAGVRFWAFKNPDLRGELLVPDFPSLRACLVRSPARGRP